MTGGPVYRVLMAVGRMSALSVSIAFIFISFPIAMGLSAADVAFGTGDFFTVKVGALVESPVFEETVRWALIRSSGLVGRPRDAPARIAIYAGVLIAFECAAAWIGWAKGGGIEVSFIQSLFSVVGHTVMSVVALLSVSRGDKNSWLALIGLILLHFSLNLWSPVAAIQ